MVFEYEEGLCCSSRRLIGQQEAAVFSGLTGADPFDSYLVSTLGERGNDLRGTLSQAGVEKESVEGSQVSTATAGDCGVRRVVDRQAVTFGQGEGVGQFRCRDGQARAYSVKRFNDDLSAIPRESHSADETVADFGPEQYCAWPIVCDLSRRGDAQLSPAPGGAEGATLCGCS